MSKVKVKPTVYLRYLRYIFEVDMKRSLGVLFCVVCALALLTTLCVFAGVDNGDTVVVLDTVSGVPGSEVTLNLTLTENPGITGLRFFVKYDAAKLELTKAEYTKLGGGGLAAVNMKNNPFVLLWNVSTYEFTDTGVLCRLTFKIKEGAAAGASDIKLSWGRGDCIDFDLKNLSMDVTDGKVNVLYDGSNCSHSETRRDVISNSDCSQAGQYRDVCKTCATVTGEGTLPLADHSYGKAIVVKVPTHKEIGLKEQECSVCHIKKTEPIDKLPAPATDEEELTPPSSDNITSSLTSTEDTQGETGDETTSLDSSNIPSSPATGDETVVFLIVSVVALLLFIFVVILKIRNRFR